MSRIAANFGADTSELEAKMLSSSKSVNRLESSVKRLDGQKINLNKSSGALVGTLSYINPQLGSMARVVSGLTRGFGGIAIKMLGVGAAGYAAVKGFGAVVKNARDMGEAATDSQKALVAFADKVGEGFALLSGKAKSAYASVKDTVLGVTGEVLGSVVQLGGAFRDLFLSDLQIAEREAKKAAKAIADATEQEAERLKAQRESFKQAMEATKGIEAQVAAEKEKTRQATLQLNTSEKLTETMLERRRLERELAELAKQVQRDGTGLLEYRQKELELQRALTREVTLSKQREKELNAEIEKQVAENHKANQARISSLMDQARKQAQERLDLEDQISQIQEARRWAGMTDEERLLDIQKRGRDALAKYEADKTAKNERNLLALRQEYEALERQITTSKGGDLEGLETRNNQIREQDEQRISARRATEEATRKAAAPSVKLEKLNAEQLEYLKLNWGTLEEIRNLLSPR